MFEKNKNQIMLLVANAALVFFAIVLFNLHVLPLRMGDFIFFAILTLALALYRPGWGFLFFVGSIALENINLAPVEIGIAIRPYQFLGGLTILAILIRLLGGRLNFRLIKMNWYDWAVIVLVGSSFFSALFSSARGASFKQSIVLASFVSLYFLVRNYIQTLDDLKKVIPFFLSSSIVIVLYGIWQNIQFMRGASHFEVMPGRPNGTFAEADWLGIFLVFLLAIMYIMMYWKRNKNQETIIKQTSNLKSQISKNLYFVFCILYLMLIFAALILTVSRSAWLGALGVTFIFLLSAWTGLKMNYRQWQWRETFWLKMKIIFALLVGIAIVYIFHLTNFQLANRAQSTGGLQKITISCDGRDGLQSVSTGDMVIQDLSDLQKLNCRHINLEEIEDEKKVGHFVTEIYRRDPNVNVRAQIYQKSWNLIKQNPILGVGWGEISAQLGTDERGAGLNTSNIFLELWLGAGIVGLLAFLSVWLFILFKATRDFFLAKSGEKILPLFILLGWFALTIPNLFNAGILLGFFWLFLGLAYIKK